MFKERIIKESFSGELSSWCQPWDPAEIFICDEHQSIHGLVPIDYDSSYFTSTEYPLK